MAEGTKQEDVLQEFIQVFKNKTFSSKAPQNRQKPTFFYWFSLTFRVSCFWPTLDITQNQYLFGNSNYQLGNS